MEVFSVHILAADRTFFEGECVSLVIPTITGMYGICLLYTSRCV